MKNKTKAKIFYIISIILLFFYFILELPFFTFYTSNRLILLFLIVLFIYLGGLFLAKELKNNKPMLVNLKIFFALYILLYLTLTLFDTMWGRGGITFNNRFTFNNNFIPFKTIINFISKFDSLYDANDILFNLLGNFIALMPLSFFLPLFFKSQNKFSYFLLTILGITLCTETIQMISGIGVFDIDDIILNTSGAIIMFFVLKINCVNNLVRNILLLEKNKIAKKDVIKIIISIIIVFITILSIILYCNYLYKRSFDKYLYITNPVARIEDIYPDCNNSLNIFYEDEYNTYSFLCSPSDQVYIFLNNEKYLVTDVLEGKTKYNYDINKVLNRLEYYNVKYKIIPKYEMINIKIKNIIYNNSITYPNVSINIENEELLQIIVDDSKMDAEYSYINLYFKGLKEGKTKAEIIFKNKNTHEIIESQKYIVTINDNLKVNYVLLST